MKITTGIGALKPSLIVVMLLMLVAGTVHAATDTLTLAKSLDAKNKFRQSAKLLKPYYNNHPGNLSAQWIYGQTLYFGKRYKKAEAVYEYAIKWHPENYYLRLDYALKLVDIGEVARALPTLNLYLKYDPTAGDVHLALAKIDLWRGDYTQAMKELDKVLKKDPSNHKARDLRREVLAAQSSWIKLSGGFYRDDQPMTKVTGGIEAGVYLCPVATLKFDIKAPVFWGNNAFYNSEWFQVGNIFSAAKAGFKLELDAGAIRLPNAKYSGTGKFDLNQTFAKHLVLSALVEHKPYLSALADLTNPIMELHYQGALTWLDKNGVQARAAFDADQFYTDNNIVYTASAWIMTPPLKVSVFEFRLGYGYNFSTSQQSRYESTQTISQIKADWDSTYKIPGAYNPYFTPYKQSVNSAILSINIHPAKIVDIGLKGNIGFYATTYDPYLYLSTNSADSLIIARGFAKKTFLPGEADAYVAVQITPQVNLKAEYTYFVTNFYTSQYAGLALQINFWNEKKKR